MYRTFVQFSAEELNFLRGLQKAWQVSGASKSRPPMTKVIRAILHDYEHTLKEKGDPDFVRALRKVTKEPRFRTVNKELG